LRVNAEVKTIKHLTKTSFQKLIAELWMFHRTATWSAQMEADISRFAISSVTKDTIWKELLRLVVKQTELIRKAFLSAEVRLD